MDFEAPVAENGRGPAEIVQKWSISEALRLENSLRPRLSAAWRLAPLCLIKDPIVYDHSSVGHERELLLSHI